MIGSDSYMALRGWAMSYRIKWMTSRDRCGALSQWFSLMEGRDSSASLTAFTKTAARQFTNWPHPPDQWRYQQQDHPDHGHSA